MGQYKVDVYRKLVIIRICLTLFINILLYKPPFIKPPLDKSKLEIIDQV